MPLSRRCLMILACLPALLLLVSARGQDDTPKPATGSAAPTLEFKPKHVFKLEKRCWAVSLSRDGKFLAANDGPRARVWDTRTGQEVAQFTYADETVTRVALSPDGKWLAFASGTTREIHLADVRAKKLVRTIGGFSDDIEWPTFAPDGKTLAFGIFGDGVKLWDVETGKDLHRFTDKLAVPVGGRCQAFSPDGKILALALQDGVVRLLSAESGKEIRQLVQPEGQTHKFSDLAFSPDGRFLALGLNGVGDEDTTIWAVRDGKVVQRVTWEPEQIPARPGRPPTPPTMGTTALAFTADSRCLVGGCLDKRLRVWETATGGLRYQVTLPVLWIAATSSSTLLAIVSRKNDEISLWDYRAGVIPPRAASPPDLEKIWPDLGTPDAARACAMMREMASAPRETVAALDKRLPTAPVIKADALDSLIADLDDDRPETRDRASARLAELGDTAEPALSKARGGKPSAEARRRITELLDLLKEPPRGARLRLLRAVEVLESLGSPQARQALKRLAGGEPKALITREAKAALGRLSPE